MSAKPEAAASADKAPAKSNKMLIIIIAAVVVLALGGGGAFFYISKQRASEDEPEKPKVVQHDPKAVPFYLPLDNMVINLADQGGDRVAQVGITLEVRDAKAIDTVKSFLPTIRSGILMQLSQRTAEELLTAAGKEKFAKAILREASIPFGGGHDEEEEESLDEEEAAKKKKKKGKKAPPPPEYPVIGVHFSSFIVQ